MWQITDTVEGTGAELVHWRLHMAAIDVVLTANERVFALPGSPSLLLTIDAPDSLATEIVPTEASDRYGVKYVRPCILLSGTVQLPVTIRVTFTVQEQHAGDGA